MGGGPAAPGRGRVGEPAAGAVGVPPAILAPPLDTPPVAAGAIALTGSPVAKPVAEIAGDSPPAGRRSEAAAPPPVPLAPSEESPAAPATATPPAAATAPDSPAGVASSIAGIDPPTDFADPSETGPADVFNRESAAAPVAAPDNAPDNAPDDVSEDVPGSTAATDAAIPESVVTNASGAVPRPLGKAALASVPITSAASAAPVGSTDVTACSDDGEAVAAGEAGADAVVEDEVAVDE